MKQIVFILVIAMLLSACGAKTPEQKPEANPPAETVETTTPGEESVPTPEIVTPAPEKKAEPAPEKKEGYKVTFLEIGAESCIPCRMMQPVMKEIAAEYPGVVKVVFHDLYKEREIGPKYNIRVMPTQVFLDASGREFFRHEGFYPKDEIKEMLDRYLMSIKDK
ncbi:MAG: thioredoxin family protein [Candidatus Cloacimonadaceae bacterium]|nr:thioredoxin family protein [Candidatus Cloacimonadaceae bacterium]